MIPISIILLFLIVHFLADFALQTDDQARLKSIDEKHLFRHVSNYSLCWLVVGISLFGLVGGLYFAFITFICHYATDYYSSRLGKPFWEKGDYHNGFNVVGADQVLHYIQLFFTYLLFQDML